MRLETKTKRAINKELRGNGFDGNGRFNSLGEALGLLSDVIARYELAEFGMMGEVTKEGKKNFYLFHDKDRDGENATEIDNALLVVTWYTFDIPMETDLMEVIAYIS